MAIIQDMDELLSRARIIPPMPIMGAKKNVLIKTTTSICICVISFVVLVISDAVENLSISTLEKLRTLANTSLRKLRESPAATLEPKKPTPTIQMALIIDMSNIIIPVRIMYLFWILSMFISSALYSAFTAPIAA